MTRLAAVFVAIVAIGAHGQVAPDKKERPTLKEYKDGKAADKDKVAAVAAKQAKMAAVDKVVTMMAELRAQVIAEGEKEAASYNKFSCFCKDTTAEKTAAIKRGEDEIASLNADITSDAADRDELDEQIKTLLKEIKENEKEMKEAQGKRAKTLEVYTANEADLAGALYALENAIEVLKKSKAPSLAQLQSVSKTVQTAVLLADALGLSSASTKKAVAVFLQEPVNDVPMEDYKFHSDGIIGTLEKLLKDFENEKNEVDAEEVKSVQAFDMFMQEKTDILKAKNVELADAKKDREKKISEIATASEQLTTVSAVLEDDQDYLMETAKMCSEKAQTWDVRSKVRRDEITALTSATRIIKSTVTEKTTAKTARLSQQAVSVRLASAVARDPDSMEALEQEAEAADSFIQMAQSQQGLKRWGLKHSGDNGRQAIVDLLTGKGKQLKSALLTSLAQQIASDPFAKIKVLIQELIERLLTEAADEANQKGWCDKALADAKQKRDYAAKEVAELNGNMATYEARRDKLTESLAILTEEIAELNANRKEATEMRTEEKAENEITVQEAQAGLDAVNQAADILSKYYKTAAKAEVVYSLAQGPADDAPDAGFDNGEAYTGSQGTAGGILGMLDVIKSDFERTISETEKAEAAAEQEYLEFMTETGMSLAKKTEAEKAQSSQLDDTKEKLATDTEAFEDQSKILNTAIQELLELQPTCIDTGMSYDERVARRNDEIASLNKALCILERYAEFGPEGAADGC